MNFLRFEKCHRKCSDKVGFVSTLFTVADAASIIVIIAKLLIMTEEDADCSEGGLWLAKRNSPFRCPRLAF